MLPPYSGNFSLPWKERHHIPRKRSYPPTKLDCVISILLISYIFFNVHLPTVTCIHCTARDTGTWSYWIELCIRCFYTQTHAAPIWLTLNFGHSLFIHSLVFSFEGRAWQEPEPSQVTGMALAHCILGKFLGVVCHCFPAPLDVPTSAAMCLRPQRRERS